MFFRSVALVVAAICSPILGAEPPAKARISITLDLEMSAEYPQRGIAEWNYEKGNLDEPTKRYALEAARIVKERGGVIHFFCVGRVLEQPDVDWLKQIVSAGHPIGNHTYDHVNVLARTPEETQFRFQRAPWLVDGLTAREIIEHNIRLTSLALERRVGISPNGFRTPGGFAEGLAGRKDIQQLLRAAGFAWVSSKYPKHDSGQPGEPPTEQVYQSIVEAQANAQPFVYPSGLIEIPMSPISDVSAFRTNRWKLEWYLRAVRMAIERVIDRGMVFDFLAHPSCLVVEDPEFEAIKLICDLVRDAGDRAEIVGLDKIAIQSSREEPRPRVYSNVLKRIDNPQPLLTDYPELVQPVTEESRFEAPPLVDDANADLDVRAWRFSYNARGIIELPNRLSSAATAVIMVHPWGIDDGQGWRTPEPAGVCDFCTPTKNHLAAKHTREVIDPFLKKLRPRVALTMFSLPGDEDQVRKKLYRSFTSQPSAAEQAQGRAELREKLNGFEYRGDSPPSTIELSQDTPVTDYFRQFPGLDAGPRFNNAGFWNLPIPISADVQFDPHDVVIYDAQGYPPLRDYLKRHGVRHVLLTGYATDMCYRLTTAGYENLAKDFNVFLVGDATLATFPANDSPRYATNAAISFAALNHLITQVSWVRTRTPFGSRR